MSKHVGVDEKRREGAKRKARGGVNERDDGNTGDKKNKIITQVEKAGRLQRQP